MLWYWRISQNVTQPMMQASWVWFLLSLACAFIFIYPYAVYPIVLRLLRKESYTPLVSSKSTSQAVALVFCAYNEEQALPSKIENIRTLKSGMPELQVYAYSDGSSDGTNEILLGAKDVLTPVIAERRMGKVIGMRRLVSMTDADIIVFTDANVIVRPDSLSRLLRYFVNPEIGAVAGTLVYSCSGGELETSTAKVGGLYWRLEEHIKRLESETGSTMGADGAIFARRRSAYPEIPAHLVDDLAASISVLFDRKRCVSAPDVYAYEFSVTNSREEFKRKRRIACGSYSTYRYLIPQLRKLSLLNRFKFISHKILRWYGVFFLTGTLVSFLIGGVATGLGIPAIGIVAVAIVVFWSLAKIGLPLVSSLYEVIRAVGATGIGVIESLAGRSYQIWTPAKTR